jgi:hypothetical protein
MPTGRPQCGAGVSPASPRGVPPGNALGTWRRDTAKTRRRDATLKKAWDYSQASVSSKPVRYCTVCSILWVLGCLRHVGPADTVVIV